jgi:hypothetical protein
MEMKPDMLRLFDITEEQLRIAIAIPALRECTASAVSFGKGPVNFESAVTAVDNEMEPIAPDQKRIDATARQISEELRAGGRDIAVRVAKQVG